MPENGTKQFRRSVITFPRKVLEGVRNKAENGAERCINCPANIVADGTRVNEAA